MTNLKGNNFVIFFRFFCLYFNRKLVVISCRSTISTRLVCSRLVTLHVHVISMLLQNYYVSMAYILLPILTFWKSSIFSLLGEFSLVCIRNIAIITNALAKMKRYKHHITKSISRQPCVMRTGFCLDISKKQATNSSDSSVREHEIIQQHGNCWHEYVGKRFVHGMWC